MPAVNASLVDELLECLTRSWRCALMRRHVTAELDVIADAAGWQSSGGGAALSIDELDWGAEPPSYYTSVIASWSGLPLAARGVTAPRARAPRTARGTRSAITRTRCPHRHSSSSRARFPRLAAQRAAHERCRCGVPPVQPRSGLRRSAARL